MALTPLPEPLRPTVPESSSASRSQPGWPEVELFDAVVTVQIDPVVSWYSATKSVIDWFTALALLVPALPLIGVCWLAVRLTSPGPGFYLQSRLGRGGREYRIIKLRTMAHKAEEKTGGAKWSTKGDMRITRLGAFLRKTHFDELPQLFNVLMGQMSLVGPRPERKSIIDKLELEKHVPGYAHRLLVKPGVTGLAQVQLPADEDINSVKHKVVYDLYYIENYSLWLDLRLMLCTVFKAAGLHPRWAQRVFWLPHRDTVAEVFQSNLTPSPLEQSSNLQPV
ncbi:sugar transferase [Limnoglobus roseus]|uniref:Putative glycosyltransferase n=1 Tax=Limnoglobus roseus TaxID=2598579 RepID=A0A5C1AF76_9BACT|nr:sugar transferase [Limnoglobus roseus]QEL17215.1 putative glycosyltransferase [Limnoglobus roseus]